MATASVLTKENPEASRSPSPRLENAMPLEGSLLRIQLQQLVECTAALVDAPLVTLAVLNPASQAPIRAATCSTSFDSPRTATLRVHQAVARWVTRHRTPLLVGDGASDPRVRALGLGASGSLLSVPLLSRQEMVGALTITSPVINAYSQPHHRLLEMVANLGALAISQARLLDAVAQQTHQQSILLEVSRGLATTSDTRTIVGLTVSALRRLSLCEEAALFRYHADTETLSAVAGLGTQSHHLAEAHLRVSDPQSVTAWVARQRRTLLYAGETNGFLGQATEVLLMRCEMALLAVPLVVGERLLGVIMLARAIPFATADLRPMLTLGHMIAPALAQTGYARSSS